MVCGPTPESAILRMLARFGRSRLRRNGFWVYCGRVRMPWVARGVNLDQFEGKVRELGIWGGAAWRRVLADDEFPARGEGSRRPPVQFNAAEKALIREIIEFVPAGNAEAVPRITARDARAMLDRLQKDWMSGSDAAGTACPRNGGACAVAAVAGHRAAPVDATGRGERRGPAAAGSAVAGGVVFADDAGAGSDRARDCHSGPGRGTDSFSGAGGSAAIGAGVRPAGGVGQPRLAIACRRRRA